MKADDMNNYKVMFLGHGGVGSNALSLFCGFQESVQDARLIDTSFVDSPGKYSIGRVVLRFFPNLYGVIASQLIDIKVRKELRNITPDIVVVFKGNFVKLSTLNRTNAIKVHYHPDDSSNLVNRTQIFNATESFYDIHFTSKRHNINEIEKRTGRRVFFIWYAYDERWHFRVNPLSFENHEFKVGFIGHMRINRKDLIIKVAKLYGKNFAITGNKWKRIHGLSRLATITPPSYGKAFSAFVATAPLQLGLLNSDNRDQHTARSFEVPASGGLLLAEDTPEHREIFFSDSNALFFKTPEDLLEKITWVNANPVSAATIAENGYQHIRRNANTWKDRSLEMLGVITENEIKMKKK